MDSFRRDPGETSERGAKRPRLPAVFEAVKAGRFDELSLSGEIVAQALTFLAAGMSRQPALKALLIEGANLGELGEAAGLQIAKGLRTGSQLELLDLSKWVL